MLENILVVSTAHITEETGRKIMEGLPCEEVTAVYKPIGYFVSFTKKTEFLETLHQNPAIPNDLAEVIEYAAKNNAYYIDLNTEVDPIKELKSYE